ncbi:RNA-binding 20 [Pelobates cultripes]|uniref:RNA-binding 20 n=1 Tax=Pelobates cultripes TaxID=61616 RepID=A0AAD1T4V5_PELCU|nr:RNA-binding 20 [Pelobates cultripes]
MFRDTDRYRNEMTRSRSPVSRSLSPRSHTPSYTSCSSTHSPLGTTRTEWGNGRESWDQTAYGRWEEDREQGAWRDSAEEKRDRTDHWVHERKHYSRQLEKLELDDRTDASRGHRDKYGNPHSTRYKGREGKYYRKESKLKSEGKSQDTSGKPKRKEEGKVRDVKESHSEDLSKKEISEPKSMKECDSEKDTDKSKKINSSGEEELNEGIKKSKDERPPPSRVRWHNVSAPVPSNKPLPVPLTAPAPTLSSTPLTAPLLQLYQPPPSTSDCTLTPTVPSVWLLNQPPNYPSNRPPEYPSNHPPPSKSTSNRLQLYPMCPLNLAPWYPPNQPRVPLKPAPRLQLSNCTLCVWPLNRPPALAVPYVFGRLTCPPSTPLTGPLSTPLNCLHPPLSTLPGPPTPTVPSVSGRLTCPSTPTVTPRLTTPLIGPPTPTLCVWLFNLPPDYL